MLRPMIALRTAVAWDASHEVMESRRQRRSCGRRFLRLRILVLLGLFSMLTAATVQPPVFGNCYQVVDRILADGKTNGGAESPSFDRRGAVRKRLFLMRDRIPGPSRWSASS